jgi:pyridoxamine 5'-phosphate oxidase
MNKITLPLNDLRINYRNRPLLEKNCSTDPFEEFYKWFTQALHSKVIYEPNAMILATVSQNYRPSSRVVLLKNFTEKGFIFFTNYTSRKGEELNAHPYASIVFYWDRLHRQIRIEGKVVRCSKEENRKYFQSRPLQSQIAAMSSPQSKIIKERKQLESLFDANKKRYLKSGATPLQIECPQFWGGFRLVPNYFEFWHGRENRLHDRICYKKITRGWKMYRLAP